MSKYYDALNRTSSESDRVRQLQPSRAKVIGKTQALVQSGRTVARPTGPLLIDRPPVTVVDPRLDVGIAAENPGIIARQHAIRQLCERIAPSAVVEGSCRIGIAGCRPGDGASSMAAAVALDLSQRLLVRTLLIDANLRAPALHRVLSIGERPSAELTLSGSLQFRTVLPRLTLATCCPEDDELDFNLIMADLESSLGAFPAVVIDFGVARLDPRMLSLVRPSDPIIAIVRYGRTRRDELATTAAALRSAKRTIAGVIINGKPSTSLLRSSSGEHSDHE